MCILRHPTARGKFDNTLETLKWWYWVESDMFYEGAYFSATVVLCRCFEAAQGNGFWISEQQLGTKVNYTSGCCKSLGWLWGPLQWPCINVMQTPDCTALNCWDGNVHQLVWQRRIRRKISYQRGLEIDEHTQTHSEKYKYIHTKHMQTHTTHSLTHTNTEWYTQTYIEIDTWTCTNIKRYPYRLIHTHTQIDTHIYRYKQIQKYTHKYKHTYT